LYYCFVFPDWEIFLADAKFIPGYFCKEFNNSANLSSIVLQLLRIRRYKRKS
jgi:hypothetical protein